MASGSVVEYRGKRGTVFRIKFRDADGRQVMETIGRKADGWTRKRARGELRARLVAVEREAYRKPEPMTFGRFAHEWSTSTQARGA